MIDNKFNQSQYQKFGLGYLTTNTSSAIGGGSPQERVKLLKKFLPVGRTVFEIGSGGGDDALALQNEGYKVISSDFVDTFIDKLKEKGLQTLLFDAKNDELPKDIDAIYANAVFVHFSPEETANFLRTAKEKLNNEKIIFMSVIKGEGSERSARARGFARDFQYYTLPVLMELLEKEGYEILYNNDTDPKWLQIICKTV